MKINFFNLKEPEDLSVRSGLSESHSSTEPEITKSLLTKGDYLTEYVIQEMFHIHMQSSQTLWDRKMFDDELKREGSGFIVCYSGGDEEKIMPQDKDDAAGKFGESDIYPGIKLDMQSRIIGFFIFYNVIDEMHILDITVAKEMQSKGIGTLMLDYAVKKYGSIDDIKIATKHFFLEVRVSNKQAISLYKKAGFKIFMLRKNYYDDNGEDALCMVKEL